MRIATWNVNSIRKRLPNVTAWMETMQPDVLLLQELKAETDDFPAADFRTLGYESLVAGQKSWNGVAIVSRLPMEETRLALPGDSGDPQARYAEALIRGVRVASLYLPNGNPVGSEKFTYKLDWMARLERHARRLLEDEIPVVLGGDFNVIPTAADVYDPEGWEQDALFHPDSRQAFRRLLHSGYTDAFRTLHPRQPHAWTFWDYQAGAWPKDQGFRIDHFLLSPEAADRLKDCFIDKTPRGQDNASDHTPVVVDLTPATA